MMPCLGLGVGRSPEKEMEAPGLEHSPGPRPPPPASPDEAPPGFATPNAWNHALQLHVSDPSYAHQPQPQPQLDVPAVPVESQPTVHSSQLGLGTLEPLPRETQMLATPAPGDPLLDSAPTSTCASGQTLVGDGLIGLGETPTPTPTPTVCDLLHPPETNKPAGFSPAESIPQEEEAPSHSHTMQLPSPAPLPQSLCHSLALPPSPPPIPLLSQSLPTQSSCPNLEPVKQLPSLPPSPPPPPALILHDMPKSSVLNSDYNFIQNTCDTDLLGDEISSEHEAMVPAQPPLTMQDPNIPDPAPPPPPLPPQQLKCELVLPIVSEMTEARPDNQQPHKEEDQDPPNQEMEMLSCSLRDRSFETGPPVNQITDEPPLKKSPYETQSQLTPEECQSEDEDPFESVTPEHVPHQDDDMEQIDMDMSDDDTFDRSPIDMGPPGSDTRDFASLEEAPPGYNTIDRTSQMQMISQDALSGMGQMVCGNCHELISYPHGALHVLCTCCQTINLVLEACQVGNVTCGQCSVLLMYPFGAPSVRCSCCRYVTEIGVHNMRPPLSVQQGDGCPTLECQTVN